MGALRGVQLDSNQMSLALEARIFERSTHHGVRMHCTLVTGFLGSGKTTLVQHILKQKGDLRIAVLVNEFGDVDVDGALLHAAQSAAALGTPSVHLASGCACCTISAEFRAAVKSMAASCHLFDHLIVETSGISDPRPIAAELAALGVLLDRVVAVVDAEALPSALGSPAARRQLGAADLVLVNKCDLVSLGQLADAEDLVAGEAGGGGPGGAPPPVVRTRFCRVPLDLVLSTAPCVPPPPLGATTANSAAGFLSHEAAALALAPTAVAATPGGAAGSRRWEALEGECGTGGCVHEADGFVSATFESRRPLRLAAFQRWAADCLRSSHGILRAKGVLWFRERRGARYIFQSSGCKRSEAAYAGQWESPPACCLVVIGRDAAEVAAVRDALASADSGADVDARPAAEVAAQEAALRAMLADDSRFKAASLGGPNGIPHGLNGTPAGTAPEGDGAAPEGPCGGVLVFGLVGNPLRGVLEVDLNDGLMREVNGRGELFLSTATLPRDGSLLQLALDEHTRAADTWQLIQKAAQKVLTKAYKNSCPCRCDITPSMVHRH